MITWSKTLTINLLSFCRTLYASSASIQNKPMSDLLHKWKAHKHTFRPGDGGGYGQKVPQPTTKPTNLSRVFDVC